MKIIKTFESFIDWKKDWKKSFLIESGLLEILNNLAELSLEYLDQKHFVQDENYSKSLVFVINFKEGDYISTIISGHFNHKESNLEDNLEWIQSEESYSEILDKLKLKTANLIIEISVVANNDAFTVAGVLGEDTSEIYGIISEMYPEVEFDTIQPWDLN